MLARVAPIPIAAPRASQADTPNAHAGPAFPGAIYRTLRTRPDGAEVQDQAFSLATQAYHFPRTGLVTLRGPATPPVALESGAGAPRWRQVLRETGLPLCAVQEGGYHLEDIPTAAEAFWKVDP